VAISGSLESIEGIGPVTASKLRAVGVNTAADLLNAAGTSSSAAKLAKQLGKGFTKTSIRDLAEIVELEGLVGVGAKYSQLLRIAGINSKKELARRNPAQLHAKLQEINTAHKRRIVKQLPSLSAVTDWITLANGGK